jgi:hypothetical protein
MAKGNTKFNKKSMNNLKPLTCLPKEDAKIIRQKGANALNKKLKEKKSLTQCLKLLLEQDHIINEQTKTGSEWLTVSLFEKALAGDVTAQKMIFERIEGITPQNINIDEKQEITLNIIKRNE